MASLTIVAFQARRLIKFGGVGLFAFLILYSLAVAGIKAYIAAHPPYRPPTVRYGLLPQIVFPDKQFTKKTFTKELSDDKFPDFSDQMPVYIVYRPGTLFQALKNDTQIARDLGFTSEPLEVSTGVYEFKNTNSNQTLTMNVLDGSFNLLYPYKEDQLLLTPGNVPAKNDAIKAAKEYLSSAKKLTPDLEAGTQKISYWKIEYDGLKSVPSQSDANIVRVDFFRQDLPGDHPILSSEINRAPISILVTGSTVAGKKIAEVNFKYVDIGRESYSTYPIKTPSQAYADLEAGAYWPVSDLPDSNITIRRVRLAYFEPITLTNYLQPVYVFEGDKNFTAYVPAVDPKWIQKK